MTYPGRYPVGADSDQLRRPAFQAYEDHMSGANQALYSTTGAPKTVTPRSSIDVAVNSSLPEPWTTLVKVGEGLVNLPNGDAKQVQDFAAYVEAAEASANDMAKQAFPDPVNHHNF